MALICIPCKEVCAVVTKTTNRKAKHPPALHQVNQSEAWKGRDFFVTCVVGI